MASTTFVNYQTVIDAGWLNDVNSAVYSGTFQATTLSPTNITVSGAITANGTISGSGFSTYLASPPAIGGTTAAAGAFTTLSASSTVSGTGFNTYLASPPAIGGTTAASGKFTTLTSTSDATLHGLTVGLGAGSVSTNTAIGTSVLASGSLTGGSNTGVGYQALNGVTSGDSNSAFGISALTSITTGASNTGIGRAAVGNTTTGSYNTAVGRDSLLNNTTASNNTAVGYQAGYNITTGGNNSAFGAQIMDQGTGVTGTENSAFGRINMRALTSGSSNSAFGNIALNGLTTGSYNTAIGAYAGFGVTTGSHNVYIGQSAGDGSVTSTTGSGNIIVGDSSSLSGAGDSNEIVIAYNATGKGSSTGYISANGGSIYQGNNSTLWSITSDERLKKNIVDNTVGLSAINQIKVRNFEYRLPDEITDLDKSNAVNITGTQLGPIAQELQQVLPDCVKTESTGVMSVDPSDVMWHMVNAIQELSAQVTALQAKVGA